jgi:hypothetical protein
MNSVIIYQCECGKETLLYNGNPVNIIFSQMPQAIAKAMNHKCKGTK